MQVGFNNQRGETTVIYGETVISMLKTEKLTQKQIIFCGNQRYYDLFAEKLAQNINHTNSQDWFITTNNRYCNDLSHFEDFILFLKRFSLSKETLFIGVGNEGVMELLSFSHRVSLFKSSQLWLIPLSLRALAQSLSFDNQIVLAPSMEPVLAMTHGPCKILYDQTLADQQINGKMVDLFTLLRCGIVADYQFLQQIYQNFPQYQDIKQQSFSAFIAPLLTYYKQESAALESFGEIFEKAFFKTENGHLLSNSMKNMFGLLLAFSWNIQVGDLDFNFKNFMIWLVQLQYPVLLPQQISWADYGQQVLSLARETANIELTAVGEVKGHRPPTEEELIATFEMYQQVLAEIRRI